VRKRAAISHGIVRKLQQGLIDAHRTVFAPARILDAWKRKKYADAKEKLTHRYMWWEIEKELRRYVPLLKELEAGLYDANDNLRENLLIKRVKEDGWWTFREGNRSMESLGLSPLELPILKTNNITCVPPVAPAHRSEAAAQ